MQIETTSISKRCRISHRPPYMTTEPEFYICEKCSSLYIRVVSSDAHVENCSIVCCDVNAKKLDIHSKNDGITFNVFGGFENNAIKFSFDELRPEWVYLYTFQGGQLKYLLPNERRSVVFSLAEYDAYVYCDREICRMGKEHCQFQCKRGNILYAYDKKFGLIKYILEGF